MTRAVLDPGVVISGIISPRAAPAALLRAWRADAFTLLASPALLRELRNVLLRPKFRRHLSEAQALDLVEEIARAAVLVVDPPDPPTVTPDPKDDYLVALALAARADVLVSGDRHVLGVPEDLVTVLTPRAFLDRLQRPSERADN